MAYKIFKNISAFYFNLTVLKIKKEHLQSFDMFLPLTFKSKNTRNLVNYDILCFLETLLTIYMIEVACFMLDFRNKITKIILFQCYTFF